MCNNIKTLNNGDSMNILITGEKGYISEFLYNSLIQNSHNYTVIKKSLKNGINNMDLKDVDVVVHLAALVHKKERQDLINEYKRINYSLTKDLAKLAKEQGVKHFIFISTMAVYGDVSNEINGNTPVNPSTFYGKSKLAAEEALIKLQDEHFKVSIIRPPMVYGPRCPGNFSTLKKISILTPIFPKVNNQRSMIYIGNLVEFISQIIQFKDEGIFHPQDPQYINTTDIVCTISKLQGKSIIKTTFGAVILKLFIGKTAIYKKVFGSLYYNKAISSYRDNSYQKYNIDEAIRISQKDD